jgi:sterol carrier protein 2
MVANKVYVIGVGMSKFIKPRGEIDYPGNILVINV